MKIDLTVDNMFRHPLRWGKCPIDIDKLWKFGLIYESKISAYKLKRDRCVCLYLFSKALIISNYKNEKNSY